jgi:HEAT repeat protein
MANNHEDALCRESAVAALGALATAGEVDRAAILMCLLGVMNDRPQIRRRAVLGLFQFDEAEAEEAIQGALADKDRQVRAIAGDLLGVMTD